MRHTDRDERLSAVDRDLDRLARSIRIKTPPPPPTPWPVVFIAAAVCIGGLLAFGYGCILLAVYLGGGK